MPDKVGIGLFATTVVAALVVQKALAYLSKGHECPNSPLKRVACISAPGKVLVAGGYLVLEHPNLGISVATSSRFYTTIQLQPLEANTPASPSCLTIVVESPQFYTTYTYTYNPATNKVTGNGKSSNLFVEKCIDLTMAFIKEFKTKDGSGLQNLLKQFSHSHYLRILLQANNDFYSQIKEVILN
jgi:phosphomevalonate kinase